MFVLSRLTLPVLACLGGIAWGIPSPSLLRREHETEVVTTASLLELGTREKVDEASSDEGMSELQTLEATMTEMERKAEELEKDIEQGLGFREDQELDKRSKDLTDQIAELEEQMRKIPPKPCASLAEKEVETESVDDELDKLLDQGVVLEKSVAKLEQMITGQADANISQASLLETSEADAALEDMVLETESELRKLDKRLDEYEQKQHKPDADADADADDSKKTADSDAEGTDAESTGAADTLGKQTVDDAWDQGMNAKDQAVDKIDDKTSDEESDEKGDKTSSDDTEEDSAAVESNEEKAPESGDSTGDTDGDADATGVDEAETSEDSDSDKSADDTAADEKGEETSDEDGSEKADETSD